MAPESGSSAPAAAATAAAATPSFHQLLAWSDAAFLIMSPADAVPLYVSPSAAHVFGAAPAALLGCVAARRSRVCKAAPSGRLPAGARPQRRADAARDRDTPRPQSQHGGQRARGRSAASGGHGPRCVRGGALLCTVARTPAPAARRARRARAEQLDLGGVQALLRRAHAPPRREPSSSRGRRALNSRFVTDAACTHPTGRVFVRRGARRDAREEGGRDAAPLPPDHQARATL
jgi:hypothetical protein